VVVAELLAVAAVRRGMSFDVALGFGGVAFLGCGRSPNGCYGRQAGPRGKAKAERELLLLIRLFAPSQ